MQKYKAVKIMETKKTPRSIKIIYWILNVKLVGTAILLFIAIVMNVFLYTSDYHGTIEFLHKTPIKMIIKEKGETRINDERVGLHLHETKTEVGLCCAPKYIYQAFHFISYVLLVSGFYIIWIFRRFFINVMNHKTFTKENILLLKNIAYAYTGVLLFIVLYRLVFFYSLAVDMKFENAEVARFPRLIDINLFLIPLFLWGFAYMFIKGLKLKEETELTI